MWAGILGMGVTTLQSVPLGVRERRAVSASKVPWSRSHGNACLGLRPVPCALRSLGDEVRCWHLSGVSDLGRTACPSRAGAALGSESVRQRELLCRFALPRGGAGGVAARGSQGPAVEPLPVVCAPSRADIAWRARHDP